jgi:hypothetical protein
LAGSTGDPEIAFRQADGLSLCCKKQVFDRIYQVSASWGVLFVV